LPEKVVEDRAEEANLQTAETFAEEVAIVAASAPELRWRQPSLHDADRMPPVIDLPPKSELTDPAPPPVGAGPLRGTLLHKLAEEVITGELEPNLPALTARAEELLAQLRSQSPVSDTELPDPGQAAALIRDTFAIADVADLRPFFEAEVAVWSAEGATLLAGRVDALIVREGRVLGVLDWKSDVNPSPKTKSDYVSQLGEYLSVTGAVAGALVFMTPGEVIWLGDREKLFAQVKSALLP